MVKPGAVHSADGRQFYKYMPMQAAIKVIESCALRWSSPQCFNDPYDTRTRLPLKFDSGQLLKQLNEEWAHRIEHGKVVTLHPTFSLLTSRIKDLSHMARVELARELSSADFTAEFQSRNPLRELLEGWEERVRRSRVLCLSSSRDVGPMWVHYSDQYRGVVLAFRAEKALDSPFLLAREVEYADGDAAVALAVAWVDCILDHAETRWTRLFTDFQYRKASHWSYEKEWRIINYVPNDSDSMITNYKYHPLELSAVLLGPRVEQTASARLSALAREQNPLCGIFSGDFDSHRNGLTFTQLLR